MTGVGPRMGPCEPFTTWAEIGACGQAPSLEVAEQDLVVALASDMAWGLLGERFTGECSRTVEPCWRGGCFSEPCRCSRKSRIYLGALPVWGVDSVVIDGVELENLSGDTYWVEDWAWLVRADGVSWPRCQGDWSITFQFGTPIPPRARWIASRIGLELAKLCAGGECALDPRVMANAREGVTFVLPDSRAIIDQGFTGIPMVDLAIQSLGGRGSPSTGIFDMAGGGMAEVTWTLEDA